MSEPILWPADELLSALDGILIAGETNNAEMSNVTMNGADGISIDSRDIARGDAFFAIKGELSDGHDYVQKAAENGASVVVISDEKYAQNVSASVVLVDDVLKSLARVAVAARRRTQAKIVAITGSVGKTSTKEFLKDCLQACGKTHASVKSFNNQWGVPISLARMPKDTEYGVFEIGMNHLDEITPLVKMVSPDIAIITTVAPAHLGYFKNLQQIALAKSEIFDGLAKNGTAILNRDNEFFDYLSDRAKLKNITNIVSFGSHPEADLHLYEYQLLPTQSKVTVFDGDKKYKYEIGVAGKHQISNSLAVLLAIKSLDIDLVRVLSVLSMVELTDGRGAQSDIGFKNGHIKLIDESYNANPASMVAAFSVLSAQIVKPDGRKVAIIGDMLELGTDSPQIHAQLAAGIVAADIDLVLACGPDMKNCYELLPANMQAGYAPSSALLVKKLNAALSPNDVVMVKGSLGTKMSEIINKLKETSKAAI
ncbi:MAG: UDP-N-acetylmuramoylalanyl-D-glutamyl-2,6-diaminopimelate--D-alanyl-D-alanine ligase [Rhizobiales bacterium]|nr:UDP-N-acetylmuramoylalanyl-D-glutamyl-2,6-diaminopimelate--D-alanyl-D-alanine ligase [Hyphomicrobiales bacterium]NRB13999.1 UDP-N-acetylmuramoylalanyl-D-glutamyl-2,6-diaminopimelate--D-alanyl-D-alanine ligase [Hyphomicrobiales bacterium]